MLPGMAKAAPAGEGEGDRAARPAELAPTPLLAAAGPGAACSTLRGLFRLAITLAVEPFMEGCRSTGCARGVP